MDRNARIREYAVELWNRYPDQVKLNEPLRGYTTYGVGGPASAICSPASVIELQDIISGCHQKNLPFYILGSGSNILVHDSGVTMIVIRLDKCCSQIRHQGKRVYAGAGVLVSELVAYCEENHLAGLDFMSGIPGTVGGALRMNAGAFVGEIGDRVTLVEAMRYDGQLISISGEEAGFGYRRADHLQDKIMLGCRLQLLKGDRIKLQKTAADYLGRRADKQPLEYGSCGSVFKRPPGNYAGALIEKAGCKGRQIGGAMVSPKHANFIVNYHHASARDIYQLICEIQKAVYDKFRIWLELEVKLVGFSAKEEQHVKTPPK